MNIRIGPSSAHLLKASTEPGDLEPELLGIAVRKLLLDALVKRDLIAHATAHLVHPEVVSVAQEVVVGDESVERRPDQVDVDGADQAEAIELHVGKMAVEERRAFLAPATDVLGKGQGVLEREHKFHSSRQEEKDWIWHPF